MPKMPRFEAFFRNVRPMCQETVHQLALGIAAKLKEGRPSGADVTDAAVFFDVGGLFFVDRELETARDAMVIVLSYIFRETYREDSRSVVSNYDPVQRN